MVGFSVQDVAFGGFADVRAHPRALWIWTPLAFLTSLALQFVSFPMAAVRLDELPMNQNPAAAMAQLQKVLPAEFATLAVGLLVVAVVQTAMIRMILRPGDSRFGYVRLGRDELRQLGLAVFGAAVLVLISFAVIFVLAVALGLLGGMAGAPTWLVIWVDMAATVCVAIVASVRLSLAPALTFDRRRIDLFGSWRLTRGRFWPLFGTYVMVLGLCAVVYIVAAVLIFGLGRLILASEIDTLGSQPATLMELFTPMRLILAAFSSFLAALVWPVLLTPSVRLYAALSPAVGGRSGAAGVWG